MIRIQPCETLPEILETPATAPQVKSNILFNTLLLPIYSTAILIMRQTHYIMLKRVFCVLKESEHVKIVERRAVQDAQTPEGLKSSPAVLEDSQLPLEQKKRKILRNLRSLEQAGLVSASNKYQDINNDISKVYEHHLAHKLDSYLYCFLSF